MKYLIVCVFATVFAAPPPAELSAVYSDDLARNKMLPLSSAAYSDNPNECLKNALGGATLKRQLKVHCDSTRVDKCSAFSGFSEADKAIFISFRGTNEAFQLIMEGDETILKNHTAWVSGGKVSKFFHDGFMNLWTGGLKNDFAALASKYPTYSLWVTGHSLGGALSSLCADYIAFNKLFPANQVKLVNFGMPRIGDQDFATAHDNDLQYSFRVTHSHDLVAHIPLKNEQGYKHHKSEVFYKDSMAAGAKYTVCSNSDESFLCSDGNIIDASINDHLHYFDHDVSEYGYAGCKGNK